MIIIIPIGGVGQRFKENGYKKPKALINIYGKPIISYLIDNNLQTDTIDYIFIPYNKEYKDYRFEDLLIKNYPNIKIINMSIKPSFERLNDIKKIEKINSLMTAESSRNKNLIQLNFYEKIMDKGLINQSLYLRDGLHFNNLGYKILINELKLALKNII